MIRNLDTQTLRTFITVAETASMTLAAGHLHLTQGAISQQIRKLEDLLGVPLFVRARSGLKLTEAGERLFGKARRLVCLNDSIWSEMTNTSCCGEISIGVPVDLISADATPRILRSFSERHVEIELSVYAEPMARLRERMSSGQLDLAILEEFPGSQLGETLYADRLVWVGACCSEAAMEDPIPLSMVDSDCVFRPRVFEALDRSGRSWKSVFESGSREATVAMIRMDLAVGAMLETTAPKDVEVLSSEANLPPLPSCNVTLAVKQSPSRQAGMLADHIRRSFSAAPQDSQSDGAHLKAV